MKRNLIAGVATKTLASGVATKTLASDFAKKTLAAGVATKTLAAGVAKKTLAAAAVALLVAATAGDAFAQGLSNGRGLRGRQTPPRAAARNNAPAAARNNAPAAEASQPEEDAPREPHALNWDNAPSDLILLAYGEEIGKTILKDPACPKADITLKSKEGQKLSREEYLEAIETVLEMNGIHLEPYKDSFIRALPRKDVRKEGIPLIMDPDVKLGESGKVVSMMIPFENMTAEDAQKVLEGFKSNMGLLIVFERTNKILVTDTEQNINRMLEIARAIDVASPATEQAFVRQIKNASVQEVQTVLEKIVEDSQKWQEKDKAPVNAVGQNRPGMPGGPGGRSLLGRRGGQQQPAATPAGNQSLVMSVSDADRGVIRGRVTIVSDERSNKLVVITSKSNMDFFDKVIEALDVETTPDTVVKVYRLKYAEAEDVSDMINDLIGNSSSSKSTSKNQNQTAAKGSGGNLTSNRSQASKKPANQRSGDAKAGELSKDNTTVLADKRINGIVVMTDKELVPTIESIIESMDIKLSQVLIETAIVEVSLGDNLKTGVDWVRLGNGTRELKQRTDASGNPLYYVKRTVSTDAVKDEDGKVTTPASSSTKLVFDQMVPSWYSSKTTKDGKTVEYVADTTAAVMDFVSGGRAGFWTGNSKYQSMLGGGGGDTGSTILKNMLAAGTNAVSVTPIGSGLNYFFKSDALNIGAVIQASKNDNRARYLASPVVMTVDNKEATIDATESLKFFNGYETATTDNNYVRTPKYDSKDIGIKIKVKPKINPNGTVMLNIEEEYSQLGSGQTIIVDNGYTADVDTALTRKMTADILLEDMETVVLCGLTEKYKQEKESGIPILKDIPWIGKWLFGSVEQEERRKELLIFMTPYVMDDGAAAQLEAARRKKALSDPRPWDDNGWSASKLADPVAKKELLRRLEDEAKKQDEERQAKIAAEKWKVDRAKKLKEMTKKERDLWLEMHKEELKKEEQEELEEKMQDEKSQEELRKLAAEIRARKLGDAEKELKKAEEEVAAQNERAKMDAEKAKKEEEAAKPAAEPQPAAEAKPETPASVLGDIDAMAK